MHVRLSIVCLSVVFACSASSWEHHPTLTQMMLEAMTEFEGMAEVEAVSLDRFLLDNEEALQVFLEGHEAWARSSLAWYEPRPDALAFVATGDESDIRARFFAAIRVNPTIKTPLYVVDLIDETEEERAGLALEEVALLPDMEGIDRYVYHELVPGDPVSPVAVVAAASNEPDLGMDLGLYESSNTTFGAEYGFGEQPFGDPTLEYGSQAPFHMGFYHESGLVFLFAGFLKRSYPEYRIHLFRSLSEFAFAQGCDYWGWRFMGWGLHYLADLAMPYHSTVLPGYSTLRMLWINFLDLIGISKYVDNAVQLVSNRHMAIERYQRIALERAVRSNDHDDVMIRALREPGGAIPAYDDDIPREVVAKGSNGLARPLDRLISRYMPRNFVSDPTVELGAVEGLDAIVDRVRDDHGSTALEELDAMLAECVHLFAVHGRGYVRAILAAR